MQVLALTRSMRLLLALAFGAVPYVAVQVLLAHAVPWWKVPLSRISFAALGAGVVVLLLVRGLQRASRWARIALPVVCGIWGCVSLLTAYAMRSPGLGFSGVIFLILAAIFISAVESQWSKSWMDPRARWFVGRPNAIPYLTAHVSTDASSEAFIDCRVSRLDGGGVFLVSENSGTLSAIGGKLCSIRVQYRDLQVTVKGRAATRWVDPAVGEALGIRFEDLRFEEGKRLGDLVERVRGEGHEI